MNEEFWSKLEALYFKEDGNYDAYNLEKSALQNVFDALEKDLRNVYEIREPIGRGGSGIVIRIHDGRIKVDRALKIPRPIKEELLESVKNEISHLTAIKHENIINVYALGDLNIAGFRRPYPYFVMDYIENAHDLHKTMTDMLDKFTESKDVKRITEWVVDKFHRIASALAYCHSNDVIHFDVKPGNILVDRFDKPILSDLGFAKKMTSSNDKTVVGFTIFYAHPDLSHDYSHMSDKNRARKEMPPKDFKKIWDIFAFGKSLLEILAIIESRFPDVVVYDYFFVYLHLAGCRMLDGRNLPQSEVERIQKEQVRRGEIGTFKESWEELEAADFDQIKYTTFDQIVLDFDKLKFNDLLLHNVPELSSFYHKRVQSSEGIPAPFSTRVKSIIEHPVYVRLAKVPHLGLVSTVFPTATHTRLEHSLGVFRNCCLYITALYSDNYNPIFKQLINEDDVKALLLASLLHDLGHYPFAHELEEISNEFKHEKLTLQFLDNPTKDMNGHTLREIIEDSHWGWGVTLESVKQLLSKDPIDLQSRSIRTKMLSSVIDGPIDADKLDYLIRDSQRCYLKYGDSLDLDRLLRNLTIIIFRTGRNVSFSVGAYEKGQTAAESLTFARYLLYQSVYWHHTSRSIRAMLTAAVRSALKEIRRDKEREKFFERFYKFLGVEQKPSALGIDELLSFFESVVDDDGKQLIQLLRDRNYYKRILTIHFERKDGGKDKLLENFRSLAKRADFNEAVRKKILTEYSNFITSTQFPKVSQLSPSITNKTIETLSHKNSVLCDSPNPNPGIEDEDKILKFIPEPERMQRNYESRGKAGMRVSEVWRDVHFELMEIAAKGRVFCHPAARDSIMATLGPDGVRKIILDTIKSWSPITTD